MSEQVCFDRAKDSHWLSEGLKSLSKSGYFLLTGVLSDEFLAVTRTAMYETQKKIIGQIGAEKLKRAGELGVLRLMMQFDSFFFRFLALPELVDIVDHTVSSTAILHLQNGFILPSFHEGENLEVFQNQFHMDFKRLLNGYLASINIMIAIDAFTLTNGATLVIPGSHQKEKPTSDYIKRHAVPVTCPAGSFFVFDSTLWHAAGTNTSGHDRMAINHQFTRSYFKQQVDYCRALDLQGLDERSKQMLGWYTRLPSSLEEYYVPADQRLYRADQG